MPKKSSKTETDKVVAAVTPDVTPDVTPAVEKKARKPKASNVEAAVSSDAAQAAAQAVDEAPLAEQSLEFMSKLQQLAVAISALKTEYRALEKKWSREVKTAQKQTNRRKRKAGNRAPSGFVKPTKISDELASFLGKDKGTEMARTDVTREINAYIRTNKLQDPTNGRKINPDKKLSSLLKLKTTDELTYFNLQKYMSPHFAKAIPKVDINAIAIATATATATA